MRQEKFVSNFGSELWRQFDQQTASVDRTLKHLSVPDKRCSEQSKDISGDAPEKKSGHLCYEEGVKCVEDHSDGTAKKRFEKLCKDESVNDAAENIMDTARQQSGARQPFQELLEESNLISKDIHVPQFPRTAHLDFSPQVIACSNFCSFSPHQKSANECASSASHLDPKVRACSCALSISSLSSFTEC